MKNNRYSLRALAMMLGYPDAALRTHLPQLIEAIDTEAERALRAGAQVVLEVVDVAAGSMDGLGRRIGEIGQQVEIVDRRERARQIGVDERLHAAPGVRSGRATRPARRASARTARARARSATPGARDPTPR